MSDLPDRLLEQALTAIRGRDNDRALALLIEVIKLRPEMYEAWTLRGNVLHSIERPFDALLHYDRALAINANLHDAWNNRGLAFGDIGMFAEAERSFRKSAEIMPAIEPHMGLANLFCTVMRLEDAAKEYQAALEIDGGLLDARFNLGVTLLGLGRWEEGFREYEARWLNTAMPPRSYRNYPKWRGEDLNNKAILLYPEQGYGDEIMALRFARSIKTRFPYCAVTVQARGPMLRLAESVRGPGISVVPMNSDDEWQADFSSPSLDVPMMLGMGPASVVQGGYLAAPDTKMVELWRKRLSNKLGKGLNVGLCWSSGTHLNTARAAMLAKSVPLPWLKGLALPGVNLVSLQKPQEPIPEGFPITDWMDDCHDFADTAALIEALDCVISVDTAVAHLAGAMGKPVLNFVRFSGYWPWLAPNIAASPTHSIWYPSMKLARQKALMNWQEPINQSIKWLTAQQDSGA